MERLTQEQYPNVPAVVLECLNQMVEIDENRVTGLCAKLADAQATVEALQAIIMRMGEQAAVLAKDGMAAKGQVEALQREHTQLQALVRALPIVEGRIEYVNGRGWVVVTPGDVRALPELGKGLVAALLTYRATMDATTPATHEQAKATVFNEWDGALRKMADVEPKGGDGE